MKKCLLLFAVLFIFASCVIASAETYNVVGTGKNGDVHVAVTIDAGKIVSVVVGEHQETPGICEPAIEKVPQAIV
ncbi:MAG: FMN-binding protein, partial [Synergistaceae bacterium]|nr:FMN-binding protein [Synergistaceae bacterium]